MSPSLSKRTYPDMPAGNQPQRHVKTKVDKTVVNNLNCENETKVVTKCEELSSNKVYTSTNKENTHLTNNKTSLKNSFTTKTSDINISMCSENSVQPISNESTVNENMTSDRDQELWTNIVRGRRKNKNSQNLSIVGNVKNIAGIETAPKKAFIYISRLKPGTTVEALNNYITKKFPEAVCEELKTKYSTYYLFFKIIIDLIHYEEALKSDTWPYGAYVDRFFQRRNQEIRLT